MAATLSPAIRRCSRPQLAHNRLCNRRGVATASASLLNTFEAIVEARHSCGRFDPARQIPEELLLRLSALTQRSPSGFNFQPYTVVYVTDPAVREALSEAMMGAGNVARVAEAPVTAVFAADLQPMSNLDTILHMESEAGKPGRYLRSLPVDASIFLAGAPGSCGSVLAGTRAQDVKAAVASLASCVVPGSLPTINSAEGWAFKSTALAAMTYMLAATAAGLGTHPMEGFDAGVVRAACRIPDRYAIPLVVATGYPRGAGAGEGAGVGHTGSSSRPVRRSPRLPLQRVFKLNSFTQALGSAPEPAVGPGAAPESVVSKSQLPGDCRPAATRI